MGYSTATRDHEFDHHTYFASELVEEEFVDTPEDPLCRIPETPEQLDRKEAGELAEPAIQSALPWPWNFQPQEAYAEILEITKQYLPYITAANGDTGVNPHEVTAEPVERRSYVGSDGFDRNGHGTHTDGTTRAWGGFGWSHSEQFHIQGFVGQVLGSGGSGSSSGIARFMNDCIGWRKTVGDDILNIDAINLSLGGRSRHEGQRDAGVRCYSVGILFGMAAGNFGPSGGVGFPAYDFLPIAAHQQNGMIASFSSRGEIFVACPGQSITSCSHRSRTQMVKMSGTSMAAPWFTGFCCNLLALRRASGKSRFNSMEDFVQMLTSNPRWITDKGSPGYDPRFGRGVVNAPLVIRDMADKGRNFFTWVDKGCPDDSTVDMGSDE